MSNVHGFEYCLCHDSLSKEYYNKLIFALGKTVYDLF